VGDGFENQCNVVDLSFQSALWSLFKEFLKCARQEKKWWLIPLILVLLTVGAIVIFTVNSGIAWSLYPSG
jgi:hypothetical protein